jgi:hypothetical protein
MDAKTEAEIRDLRNIRERVQKVVAKLEQTRRRIDRIGTKKASK